METWLVYAILSMIFAGLTAVLAKFGLQHIPADLGLAIRTVVIFVFVSAFILVSDKLKDISLMTGRQLILLIASGLTTTLSWIYYYRALKDGPVSYVATIDKGSILITIVLSFILFKEPMSLKVIVGALLILAGMLVLVWK